MKGPGRGIRRRSRGARNGLTYLIAQRKRRLAQVRSGPNKRSPLYELPDTISAPKRRLFPSRGISLTRRNILDSLIVHSQSRILNIIKNDAVRLKRPIDVLLHGDRRITLLGSCNSRELEPSDDQDGNSKSE
jgi:hypothetical protein